MLENIYSRSERFVKEALTQSKLNGPMIFDNG